MSEINQCWTGPIATVNEQYINLEIYERVSRKLLNYISVMDFAVKIGKHAYILVKKQ